MAELSEKQVKVDEDVRAVLGLVNGSIILNNMHSTKEGIALAGSGSYYDVYNYAGALKSTGRFKSAIVTSMKHNNKGSYDFSNGPFVLDTGRGRFSTRTSTANGGSLSWCAWGSFSTFQSLPGSCQSAK